MAGEKSKKFWSATLQTAAFLPALVGGTVHGAYNALTGDGSFNDGFNETADAIMEGADNFAQEHADDLTKAAVTIATTVAAGAANNAVNHPHPPTRS